MKHYRIIITIGICEPLDISNNVTKHEFYTNGEKMIRGNHQIR